MSPKATVLPSEKQFIVKAANKNRDMSRNNNFIGGTIKHENQKGSSFNKDIHPLTKYTEKMASKKELPRVVGHPMKNFSRNNNNHQAKTTTINTNTTKQTRK